MGMGPEPRPKLRAHRVGMHGLQPTISRSRMAMAPRSGSTTLDLFVLTYNCAKNFINVAVFAAHLKAALLQQTQNAFSTAANNTAARVPGAPAALPDLVVLSLQEVAPLAYSFIGDFFLRPYLDRFSQALNDAALAIEEEIAMAPVLQGGLGDDGQPNVMRPAPERARPNFLRRASQSKSPYTLLKSNNVGMTAIMLFARKPECVKSVRVAECAFGAADMGNKGAVGLRLTYAPTRPPAATQDASGSSDNVEDDGDPGRGSTELTFVATHLAAMEYNLKRRNKNWLSIVSSLTFANPKDFVPKEHVLDEPGSKTLAPATGEEDLPSDTEDERLQLIRRETNLASMSESLQQRLQNISVFKPGSHLFLAGDLNYRIGTRSPPSLAPFPNLVPASEDYYPRFFERDQLNQEKAEGRTLHGLSEAPLWFPPTYKVVCLPSPKGAINEAEFGTASSAEHESASRSSSESSESSQASPTNLELLVPWRWASHRWPSWCDRVLYLDLPAWVKRRLSSDNQNREIVVTAYNSMPIMRTSDHQPVFFRADVPILSPKQMGLPATDKEQDMAETEDDPRLKLPVPVDIGAWERRATARRREVTAGWTLLLWSTKEGATVLAVLVFLGVWSWWLYQGLV